METAIQNKTETVKPEDKSTLTEIPESESYILTPGEEKEIIKHAISGYVNHFIWTRHEAGESMPEIKRKIAERDWLTQFEKEELFKRANANKHQGLWQIQQRQTEKAEAEKKIMDLKKKWTSKRVYNHLSYVANNLYKTPLKYNVETSHLIKVWCYFLSGDERFETELGYNFGKGLLLRGISGVGKTFIAQCLQENEYKPIQITSMLEVTMAVRNEGKFELNTGGYKIICLDDIGSEESPVNFYGTEINWFKDWLEVFYLRRQHYWNIVVSTNFSKKELEGKYGYRVRSRIEEMFNIVDVKGEDMRVKR